MADEPNARDAKLIQYLNEAYGKEKELETALQAHIALATRDNYKKRLRDHLKETKAQAKGLERRIKKLGGEAGGGVIDTAQSVANKAVSLAKGQGHAIRGTGEAEKMLKNAKTDYWNEHEEIANYISIETLAEELGDKETAKLAKDFRRQEERMKNFLEKLIPQLTKAVVKDEIPASERKPSGGSRSRSSRSSNGRRSSSSSSSRSSSSRSSSSKSGGSSGSRSRSSSAGSRSGSGSGKSSGSRTRSSSGSRGGSRSRSSS